jgi:hypothetical protein
MRRRTETAQQNDNNLSSHGWAAAGVLSTATIPLCAKMFRFEHTNACDSRGHRSARFQLAIA